jgi:hypothetical protein
VLAACSSPPRAPNITFVDAPMMVTADANGSYPLYVIVTYEHGDSPPDALHYKYPSLSVDTDYDIAPPFPANEALGFPLSIPADAMKGLLDYIVSLRTQSGLESNQVQKTVVIQ